MHYWGCYYVLSNDLKSYCLFTTIIKREKYIFHILFISKLANTDNFFERVFFFFFLLIKHCFNLSFHFAPSLLWFFQMVSRAAGQERFLDSTMSSAEPGIFSGLFFFLLNTWMPILYSLPWCALHNSWSKGKKNHHCHPCVCSGNEQCGLWLSSSEACWVAT